MLYSSDRSGKNIVNQIPDQYWDANKSRWNSHLYFDTVNHTHISDYSGDKSCDLMLVECKDGRWYIEDNWGGDAEGAKDVFNPFERHSYPTFFSSFEAAERRAAEIVSEITGAKIEELLQADE